MFSKVNTKMLKYVEDPNGLKMLLDFTVYPDLKMYYVDPKVFFSDEKLLLK